MAAKQNTASISKLGYIGRKPASQRNSDSWFTPDIYLASVRAALGTITLDPFSDAKANEMVGADYFFDEESDGLTQNWKVAPETCVFMNPPYSAGLVKQSCRRFIEAVHQQEISAGIILVNNATETKWFQHLLQEARAVCFTDHRISFWNADGKVTSNNTRGQAFFYFGAAPDMFCTHFAQHGFCQILG